MRVAYFNFYGRPARIILDEAETPELCEIYEHETGAFENRTEMTLDVISAFDSYLISKEEFEALCEKVGVSAKA